MTTVTGAAGMDIAGTGVGVGVGVANEEAVGILIMAFRARVILMNSTSGTKRSGE